MIIRNNVVYNKFVKPVGGFIVGLAVLAGIGIGAGALMGVGDVITDTREFDQVYPLVRDTADINKDNRTSMEEWAAVYKECGVEFDELHPGQLTSRQMIDYLKKRDISY
jgi:hypothetical protein